MAQRKTTKRTAAAGEVAIDAATVGALGGVPAPVVIDTASEDTYWRKNFKSRPYAQATAGYESYRPAYLYGVEATARHEGKSFEEAEGSLRRGWGKARGDSELTWPKAREAVKDAFDRTIQLREERLNVTKTPVEAGSVKLRKEVVTEQQSIEVPVEHEEVVIERRPARGRAAVGDIHEEEIRVPVKADKVKVSKETVVNEEVRVGKRKAAGTQRVSGTVRKERLKVEEKGQVKVSQTKRSR